MVMVDVTLLMPHRSVALFLFKVIVLKGYHLYNCKSIKVLNNEDSQQVAILMIGSLSFTGIGPTLT